MKLDDINTSDPSRIAQGVISYLEKQGRVDLLPAIVTRLTEPTDVEARAVGWLKEVFAAKPALESHVIETLKEAGRHTGERVQVTSAVPLTDDELASLERIMTKKLGRDISLENAVDSSILGGLIVEVGDRLYDMSLKRQFEKMKSGLT